ncbi:unnamed protein product [Gulo gulo]|uniref:Uncharacterized protein n=1 Tax=Gulo gulo TaxID=48420 RepID=A0A9X9Q7N8_GULGU|nr:unnamed protein product [Gulo gulo]
MLPSRTGWPPSHMTGVACHFLYRWCHMPKCPFRLISSPYSCVFQFGSVTGYHRPFFLLQLNLAKIFMASSPFFPTGSFWNE